MTTVPLTVVVPAHGNEDQLRLALDALFAAEPRAAEILVVDDASPRPVAPSISGYDCRTIRRDAQGGPGAARNDGVAAARHDVVLFVDSDVVVRPDTLGKVAATFERPDAPDAVFGSYDDEPGADTFLAQYRNLLHHFIHQGAERAAQTFWAGCGAIRKTSFLSRRRIRRRALQSPFGRGHRPRLPDDRPGDAHRARQVDPGAAPEEVDAGGDDPGRRLQARGALDAPHARARVGAA